MVEEDVWGLAVVCSDGVIEVLVTPPGRRPDLTLVDELARLHLAARRLGCSVILRRPCPHLRELLDLVGLTDLFEVALTHPPARSGWEVRREAEGDE